MTKAETSAAKLLGRKGGLSRSEAKIKAAKENGKKGGAPKKALTIHKIKPGTMAAKVFTGKKYFTIEFDGID